MQFKNIENYDLVKEALIEANRRDLIGFGPECLIPPRPIGRNTSEQRSKGNTRSKSESLRRTSNSKSNGRGSSNSQSSFSKGDHLVVV